MKNRERLDKILQIGSERIQAEVSSLLGKPFKLGDPVFRQVSKEDLFAGLGGKSVLAHVSLDGEIQGRGCLLVSVADAIRIGGLLIMLPDSELESVVSAQEYSDELKDSFGEVANIICGAVTYIFEEQYPKTIRLIRTEQEMLIPAKVETESDQPVPNGEYYVMTVAMETEQHALSDLTVVLPIAAFDLEPETGTAAPADPAAGQETAARRPSSVPEDAADSPESSPVQENPEPQPAEAAAIPDQDTATEPEQPPQRDLGKQKKLIDTLLKASLAKIGEDTSGLLGGELQVTPLANEAHSKESFLEQLGGKQVMARMDIRGDHPGEAMLFVESKTAICLGGSLIMLPESELDEAVRNESFNDDTRDAYGEVANIIAGAYTAIFEEQYRAKLGFVKTSMEIVVPAKIDPDTGDVFPKQAYYLSTGQITYNGKDLGLLQLLVPAAVFELEGLLEPVPSQAGAAKEAGGSRQQAAPQDKAQAPEEPARLHRHVPEETDILIYSDDEDEGNRIAEALRQLGHAPVILHFKEPVNNVLTSQIQLVLLVMGEVSEQGFGVAIKLNSAGLRVPLVAAGPAWTRSLVFKAVKYGVNDILMTPSTAGDVREKLKANLIKKAA